MRLCVQLVRCAAGYTCELEEVQCVKAPCYPIAKCVKGTVLVPYMHYMCNTVSSYNITLYCSRAAVNAMFDSTPPIAEAFLLFWQH